MHDPQLASDEPERLDGAVDVLRLERRRDLRADARLSVRHDRIRETDHVDTVLEQAFGHLRREDGIAEHDGNDGMLARAQLKASTLEALAKPARPRCEPLAQLGLVLDEIEYTQRRRSDDRGNAVREEVWPGALSQPLNDRPPRGRVAAGRP